MSVRLLTDLELTNHSQHTITCLICCIFLGYQIGLKLVFFLGLGFSSTFESLHHIFLGVQPLGFYCMSSKANLI